MSARVLLCLCAFGVRVCLRAFACVFCVCVCFLFVCGVCVVCVVCPCVCACGWLGGLIVFFVGSALRVPPAETRLTVYRRLEIRNRHWASWKSAGEKTFVFLKT